MATKVVVRHFHEGNDADRAVRGELAVYATYARIIDLDTGQVLSHATQLTPVEAMVQPVQVWAFCNRKDVPSRGQGRAIALGRLQKQFPEECAAADFGVFQKYRINIPTAKVAEEN